MEPPLTMQVISLPLFSAGSSYQLRLEIYCSTWLIVLSFLKKATAKSSVIS